MGKKKQNTSTDLFRKVVKSALGVDLVAEHRFHPVRRWRFDYALLEHKIAIEIDGGVWLKGGGRHNRGAGFIKDMEKLNAAASLGWLILRFTPQQRLKSETLEIIHQTIKLRKAEEKALLSDSTA